MWTVLWILWIVAFFLIEIPAIRNDTIEGDTLTEHVRKWFRVDTKLGRTVFAVVTGLFLVWFLLHILSISPFGGGG